MTIETEKIPTLGIKVLREERLILQTARDYLQTRTQIYGIIDRNASKSFIARIRLFFQLVIYRLIQRHINQEQDVQESLLKLIDRLIPFLDRHAKETTDCLSGIERVETLLSRK